MEQLIQRGLKGRTRRATGSRAARFKGQTLRNDEPRLEKATRGRTSGSGGWRMCGIPSSQKGKARPKLYL